VSNHRIIATDSDEGLIESCDCDRCKGKGYHHGFGEHGWDPDWCVVCGGPGVSFHELLTPYET